MIQVFDNNLNFMGVVEEFNYFSATLNYRDIGIFDMSCNFSKKLMNLLKEGYFIRYREFTGRIDSVTLYGSPEETTITVYGFDCSGFLNDRVAMPDYKRDGKTETWVRQLIRANCIEGAAAANRVIPFLSLGEFHALPQTTVAVTNKGLLIDEIKTVLKTADYGFRTVPNFEEKKLYFEVYDGVDNGVVVGKEYDNILAEDYAYSSQNNRTTVYTATKDKSIVVGDTETGYNRKEYCIISALYQEKDQSDADFENKMIQEAKKELEYSTKVYDITVPDGIELEVGEKITAVNKDWNLKFQTRVESKNYTLQDGIVSVNYIIGNDMKKGKK